jgi:excisionase family DNA binding protein
MTVSEAAAALGLSVHTIRDWISRRKIRHIRLGRAIRILRFDIEELLRTSAVPALDTFRVSDGSSEQEPRR